MTETCQMNQRKFQIPSCSLSLCHACPFKKEITRYPNVLGLHGLVFDSGGAYRPCFCEKLLKPHGCLELWNCRKVPAQQGSSPTRNVKKTLPSGSPSKRSCWKQPFPPAALTCGHFSIKWCQIPNTQVKHIPLHGTEEHSVPSLNAALRWRNSFMSDDMLPMAEGVLHLISLSGNITVKRAVK